MAYEHRRPIFDLSGSLAAAVASTDSQITGRGTIFTGLPTDLSTELYLPLVLANDGLGKSEVVWATGHSAGSPTLTVVRGREGTTPVAFDAGDVVRCSPTLRDVTSVVSARSDLPTDAHRGMRVLIASEGEVVERTRRGWDNADATRKHRWSQANSALPVVAAGQLITGMGGNQTGSAGTIASLTGGKLTLGRAGRWFVSLAGFAPGRNNNANFGAAMKWPSGAFPGNVDKYSVVGQAPNANTLVDVAATVYVPDDVAKNRPIEMYGFTNVAYNSGVQWDVTAEYLGL